MTGAVVRPAVDDDRPALLAAIADLQEVERALHDTRRPGPEVAEACLATLSRRVAARDGALFVAETAGAFAGYAAGWIEQNEEPGETADSNRFGYVADLYVVPERRGQGIAAALLAAVERHLATRGVARIRIGTLVANAAAIAAYRKAGFAPYEVALEKRVTPGRIREN